jgi:outer membrane protein TolC
MRCSLLLSLALLTVCGCAHGPVEVCQQLCQNVILPEQHSLDLHDADHLPPALIPASAPPRTVSTRDAAPIEWQLSLDEAIRIALENSQVVRVLTGTAATTSGHTIYDTAIVNTTIDVDRARFDPIFSDTNLFGRTNTPTAIFDPFDPNRALFSSIPTDTYQSIVGLTKTNVMGGQWSLKWTENPTRFATNTPFPLNPQNPDAVELSYTQPLLQGAGFAVNTAPIVIDRINTTVSFFQYKDSVQQLVNGVIQAYWALVQARVDVWARQKQVDFSEETYNREQARLKSGLGDAGTTAQARLTFKQFTANLIAAKATVLAQEGAIRNLLRLPPDDGRQIIPVSPPASKRLEVDWNALQRLAEQRRPDIIELKLIEEADRVRLIQAEDLTLPKLDAVALYRWNGLSGEMPNGERIATAPGQFTDWSIGVNFSVPLGLRQGRAQVRGAKLTIARDQANIDQQVHQAIHELASSVRDLDSAYEQYLAFKETREAAEINLKQQIARFKFGQTIYLNYLQALNDWGTAISSEALQLLNYNLTLANLERQSGTILETHGLVFNEERFRAAGPFCLFGHDRLYPSAVSPAGKPVGYPGSGEAAENAFDLKNPAPREEPGKLPLPRLLEDKPKP